MQPSCASQRVAGLSVIETAIALFVLSIIGLATIDMLVAIAGSAQRLQQHSALQHELQKVSRRLRQGVWMSGYGLNQDTRPVVVRAVPPHTQLQLGYRVDASSVFNRYDCSRGRRIDASTHLWFTRPARYAPARAELVCRGYITDIQSMYVLGFAARIWGSAAVDVFQTRHWHQDSAGIHVVEIDVLLQSPHSISGKATATNFGWRGIGQRDQGAVVWSRLRLVRALDIAPLGFERAQE